MGLIYSRFKNKESTKEILGKIHDEITLLQEAKVNTEQSKRKLGVYIIYAWIWIIVTTVALYFYYAPSTVHDKLLSAVPILIFIFMVFCTKFCFNYIYHWKLRKNDKKMKALVEKKTKILEDVMETETYKVAKEILETYAPETLHKNLSLSVAPMLHRKSYPKSEDSPVRSLERSYISTPQIRTPYVIKDSCSEVRKRFVTSPASSNVYQNLVQKNEHGVQQVSVPANLQVSPRSVKIGSALSTPVRGKTISQNRLYDSPFHNEVQSGQLPPGPPMPRPVLPRERSVFERFVDFLVGDGPSNRYALVCRQCESHNGMSLKEEFEYLAFRCVYCYYWNPAKKQRPSAPKIADVSTLTSQLQQALLKTKLDSEKNSSSEDSEIDHSKTDQADNSQDKKESEEAECVSEEKSIGDEVPIDIRSEETNIE